MDENFTYIDEIVVEKPHDPVLEFIQRAHLAVGEENDHRRKFSDGKVAISWFNNDY